MSNSPVESQARNPHQHEPRVDRGHALALAEATGTAAEEIERGVADMEIAPPDEATIVDE